jgi:hypothetical protein
VSESDRHLLVERHGALWGIDSVEVLRVRREASGLAVELTSGERITADDARGVVAGLHVVPLAPLLTRFWPQPALGLATHDHRPVVVVGPGALPAALQEGGDEPPGGDR